MKRSIAAACCWAALAVAAPATAATLVVTGTGEPVALDADACVTGSDGDSTCATLREAINHAASGDVVRFDRALDGAAIELSLYTNCVTAADTGSEHCLRPPGGWAGGTVAQFGPTAFFLTKALTIDGALAGDGAPMTHGVVIERAADAGPFRLFHIGFDGDLALTGLTLRGGLARGSDSNLSGAALGAGGAVFNQGALRVEGCTLAANAAVGGASLAGPYERGGAGVGQSATDLNGRGGGPNAGGPGGIGFPNGGAGGNGGFGGGGGAGGMGDYAGHGGSGGFGGGGGYGGDGDVVGGGGAGGSGGFGGGGGGGGVDGNGGGGNGGGTGFGGGSGFGSAGGAGAGLGGAVFNDTGRVTLRNSTFSGNTARGGNAGYGFAGSGYGGAVFNYAGSVAASFVTFSDNATGGGSGSFGGSADGGAIYSLGDTAAGCAAGGNRCGTGIATLSLVASLAVGNVGAYDVVVDRLHADDGGVSLGGGSANLIGSARGFDGGFMPISAASLGSLADNGGPTYTYLPSPGSSALDAAGDCVDADGAVVAVDQRGRPRPRGLGCDVGAVEVDEAVLDVVVAGPGSVSNPYGLSACTENGGVCRFAFPIEPTANAVTLVVSPQPHAHLESIGDDCGADGGSIGSLGEQDYRIDPLASDCTLEAVFAPDTHTVGGVVSGLLGSGLLLRLNGGDYLPIAADGRFTFATPLEYGATYLVDVAAQPGAPPQTCTVERGAGTIGEVDVDDVEVDCALDRYAVGGAVVGLVGSGLALQLDGAETLPIAGNGPFAFAGTLAYGTSYMVTVAQSPRAPAQTCTVANGAGVVEHAVADVVVTCTTNRYTVGGTVAGLEGSGLVLALGGQALAIVGDGAFAFPTPLPSGSPYAVTVATQPSAPSQTCAVANGSGAVDDADVASIVVTCTTNRYTVGGAVGGLSGSGLVLELNGQALPVTADGAFVFPTALPSGTAYAVGVLAQPHGPAQTCTVANGSGTIGGADVANVVVSCTTNRYTVGGTVVGFEGSGLVLALGGQTLAIAGDGAFAFPTPLPSGSPYAVTVATQPSTPSQTCTVANGSGTIDAADVASVAVTCTTNAYTVGGAVHGLAGSGLALQLNGGQTLAIAADGTFAFPTPLASGSAYAVTVASQPTAPTQTCTIANGTGTVGAGDVGDVVVVCTTNAYRVGGHVHGLAGGGLVLQLNGGETLAVAADGAFAFATPLASGAAYAVTVATQPDAQACTVANGSGTIGDADVDDVEVDCVALAARLRLTVDDGRDYARYGQIVDFVVTLANDGDGDASGVVLAGLLSPAFDVEHAHWQCFGAGAGATCTAEGTGALADTVTLPPGRTLTWLVDAPVRADARESEASFAVSATGATPSTATDTDLLVLLRDGFDDAYADGAATFDADASAALLAGTAEQRFALPAPSGRPLDDVIALRADGATLLVQRLPWRAPAALLRWLLRRADGSERASAWVGADSGAELSIGADVDADGRRTLWLDGAQAPLTLDPDAP